MAAGSSVGESVAGSVSVSMVKDPSDGWAVDTGTPVMGEFVESSSVEPLEDDGVVASVDSPSSGIEVTGTDGVVSLPADC